MLKLVIPAVESYDETNNIFLCSKEQVLILEHSLVSLSKWESKWHKPFLTKNQKTIDETIDYIKCMTITQNVEDKVYDNITNDNIEQVSNYIDDSMTATTFSNDKKTINRETITAEIIYYWMTAFNIPFECQKWHLNRLLTFINVCNIKHNPPKKMSNRELASRNAAINRARKESHASRG